MSLWLVARATYLEPCVAPDTPRRQCARYEGFRDETKLRKRVKSTLLWGSTTRLHCLVHLTSLNKFISKIFLCFLLHQVWLELLCVEDGSKLQLVAARESQVLIVACNLSGITFFFTSLPCAGESSESRDCCYAGQWSASCLTAAHVGQVFAANRRGPNAWIPRQGGEHEVEVKSKVYQGNIHLAETEARQICSGVQ